MEILTRLGGTARRGGARGDRRSLERLLLLLPARTLRRSAVERGPTNGNGKRQRATGNGGSKGRTADMFPAAVTSDRLTAGANDEPGRRAAAARTGSALVIALPAAATRRRRPSTPCSASASSTACSDCSPRRCKTDAVRRSTDQQRDAVETAVLRLAHPRAAGRAGAARGDRRPRPRRDRLARAQGRRALPHRVRRPCRSCVRRRRPARSRSRLHPRGRTCSRRVRRDAGAARAPARVRRPLRQGGDAQGRRGRARPAPHVRGGRVRAHDPARRPVRAAVPLPARCQRARGAARCRSACSTPVTRPRSATGRRG